MRNNSILLNYIIEIQILFLMIIKYQFSRSETAVNFLLNNALFF